MDGSKKRVFVATAAMRPDAEAILSEEVDLIFPLPEGEREAARDPDGQRKQQVRIREVLDEVLPSIHGVHGYFPITAQLIESAPNLEVIIVPGSGFENVDVAAATAHGVPIVHAAGAAYVPVAEHVIGLALSLLKWIAVADRHAHINKEQRSNGQTMAAMAGGPLAEHGMPSVLRGKTIGIVGFGFIGRGLSQICLHGFRMNVLAYDPYYDTVEAERQGVTLVDDLSVLIPQCDIVSVNSPLTPETTGMIGEREFRAMKPTAILINTSRGGLIDQDALVRALQERRIAGAGLDVSDPEPLSANHPLFDLENVVLTPHIGGISWEFMPRMAENTARDGLAVLRGERPHHLVNPEVWPAYMARLEAQVRV